MAASFPGAVKSFSAIVNGITNLVAALFNSPYDEITAIETELGTDPAGSAADLKTRLAVSMNNDGTIKNILGAWVDKSAGYAAQQAATDGFVIAVIYCDGSNTGGEGFTDVNADPTTSRAKVHVASAITVYLTMIFPVKKSDYWKIVLTGASMTSVYWIPFGA